MKGKFIVIEGIDGCGKTTQIDELSKWLPNSGLIKKGSKLITNLSLLRVLMDVVKLLKLIC